MDWSNLSLRFSEAQQGWAVEDEDGGQVAFIDGRVLPGHEDPALYSSRELEEMFRESQELQ